jgi:transcriptional regulator GlxA family with amidase domain
MSAAMPAGRLVAMVAYAGVNLIDVAGPMQAFASAEEPRPPGERTYRLVLVSEDGGPVTTSPGITLETAPLAALDGADIDTLIVPGGLPRSGVFDLDRLVAWLAANGHRPRRLCSVCTGAFLLADAGLLEGRRITTHWARAEELRRRHPQLDIEPDSIFVADGRVWTSGGVTAGIDLALALIEDDLGHEVAIATARQLVMFVKRPGGQSQYSTPLTLQAAPGFAALHGWVAEHLDEDLTVERLAAVAGMSPRSFARKYVSEVGRTPAKAIELMRLEAACRALTDTRLPLKRIAADTGLGSEQNLRRVLRRQFSIGPLEYRQRFSAGRRQAAE